MSLDLAEDRAITEEEKKNLPVEMEGFLERYIENPENGTEDSDSIVRRVKENAKRFEEEVSRFESPYIAFGLEAEKKLEEVRDSIGEPFTKMLLEHYAELTKKVEAIVSNIREKGVAYLVDENGIYKEGAVAEIEELCEKMMMGFREMSLKVLDTIHPGYAAISLGDYTSRREAYDKYLESIPEEQRGRRLNADAFEYESEQGRIVSILEMLEGEDASVGDIRKEMFELTKNMLSHMSDDLAGNSSTVLKGRGNGRGGRNLEILKNKPLAQLDFLLDIVIRSVRVVKNARVQTEMLLQGERVHDELEKTSESLPSVDSLLSSAG